MKVINILILSLLLLSSLPAHAGKIYRFNDKNGVATLSRTLPPYAAQKGYDILDEKSLRVIEHVSTREELIKDQKALRLVEQAEKEEQARKDTEDEHKHQQHLKDSNLLARYPTLPVFVKSRDADLEYHEGQINDLNEQLVENKQKLVDLQTKAAHEEMNNGEVGTTLNDELTLAKEAITKNQESLAFTIDEKHHLDQLYKDDLIHLKNLLKISENNDSLGI